EACSTSKRLPHAYDQITDGNAAMSAATRKYEKPVADGISNNAAMSAKAMLPAPQSSSISVSVRSRQREAASDASRPRCTLSSTESARGVSRIHTAAPPRTKRTAERPAVVAAVPSDIRMTCERKRYESGPATTAGGTNNQRTYL